MTPPGEDPIPLRTAEAVEGERFVDEVSFGDLLLRNRPGSAGRRPPGRDRRQDDLPGPARPGPKGLVEREVDPADTRAKRLRVTDAGAELAPRASAAVEQADAQFFRPVAVGDAVALLGRLARPETGDPPAGPE
ncbi:MarR family winged helix-turn-helix transcriptional regulator [Streptomyces sp. NPDC056544]|uniref:MarR family winged helix-turn-helix transcriptional regulator n=1 Tax=unclassified Streptomyces TaxID=2593676 RepID=UPI0036A9B6B9